jgi:hypothetical protein
MLTMKESTKTLLEEILRTTHPDSLARVIDWEHEDAFTEAHRGTWKENASVEDVIEASRAAAQKDNLEEADFALLLLEDLAAWRRAAVERGETRPLGLGWTVQIAVDVLNSGPPEHPLQVIMAGVAQMLADLCEGELFTHAERFMPVPRKHEPEKIPAWEPREIPTEKVVTFAADILAGATGDDHLSKWARLEARALQAHLQEVKAED